MSYECVHNFKYTCISTDYSQWLQWILFENKRLCHFNKLENGKSMKRTYSSCMNLIKSLTRDILYRFETSSILLAYFLLEPSTPQKDRKLFKSLQGFFNSVRKLKCYIFDTSCFGYIKSSTFVSFCFQCMAKNYSKYRLIRAVTKRKPLCVF